MGISIVTTMFSNITNPLAILSCLMIGIVPWLGKALVGLGGSLLKGIFAGKGKKQEEKREWEKRMKEYGLYQERMKQLKPTQPYSRGVDPVTEQAIMNMFASRGMAVPQFGGAKGGGQLGGGKVSRGGVRKKVKVRKTELTKNHSEEIP